MNTRDPHRQLLHALHARELFHFVAVRSIVAARLGYFETVPLVQVTGRLVHRRSLRSSSTKMRVPAPEAPTGPWPHQQPYWSLPGRRRPFQGVGMHP